MLAQASEGRVRTKDELCASVPHRWGVRCHGRSAVESRFATEKACSGTAHDADNRPAGGTKLLAREVVH